MQKSSNRAVKILSLIALGIVASMVIIPPLYTLILSTKSYSVKEGLWGSEFVALKWYKRMLSMPDWYKILNNTIFINGLTLLFGAFFVFFAASAVASIKNFYARAGIALVFAMPFAVASPFIASAVGANIPNFYNPTTARYLVVVMQTLPLAALFSLGGLFSKGSPVMTALKLTIAFVAFKLVFFLYESFDIQFLSQSSLNISTTETLGTYVYKKGLRGTGKDQSYGAAVEVIQFIFNLLPAIHGGLLLSILFQKTPKPITRKEGIVSPAVGFIPFVLVPLLYVGWLWLFHLGTHAPWRYSSLYGQSVLNSWGYAICVVGIGTAFVVGCCYAAQNMRALGAVLLCLICFMTKNLISSYLFFRNLGLLNTNLGTILVYLEFVPTLALILAILCKMRELPGSRLAIIPLSASLLFVHTWCNYSAPLLMLRDSSKYPSSLVLRTFLMSEEMFRLEPAGSVFALKSYFNFTSAIIIPILVLTLGIFGAATILHFTNRKKNAQ